ncbi:tagatose-6-phosphate ketose isomerase [Rhodanobacter sp. DHB23]|uniref:SIS domain-containing protein n=1 Tax=Rhodanobacter sp. DHB23 TaxID=2775923 RepID=UPI00177F83C1|nr:tagatose-6-phosphate ketose isomerase [Rhodanobacter sp. DHB23]MBD8872945.1 tagatose-6-phosphate ketose isomerase [Rhodanobacter sp. DHB23]
MSILENKTKEIDSLATLTSAAPAAQRERGYADTLREILQQPATWQATAALLREPAVRAQLQSALTPRPAHVVLTGSGSSIYAGECIAPDLQRALGVPVLAIPAGTLLTHRGALPPGGGLLISIARSGDSPESAGVVDQLLAHEPGWSHLAITCNASGKLATQYAGAPHYAALVLDERTNDRSLVMTSSFTNLVLSGSGLGGRADTDEWQAGVKRLAGCVQQMFDHQSGALAAIARRDFDQAVYLGSGGALGAAREAALKMLEMTGGQVITMAETFLGLRHGPMSSLDGDTLVVAYLSPDPAVRAYEYDLLRELTRKQLGTVRVLVGEGIADDVAGAQDVVVDLQGLQAADDALPLLADVVVGQVLAFFRCLALGGRPDTPSQGVLTRVVEAFALHAGGKA